MPKTRITIVGLGLIGTSIGLGLKEAKADIELVGHDKEPIVAARAHKRGAVDKTDWNLIGACEGAGLIILALPLDAIKDTLAALKQYAQPGVIITDTAPTKARVLEWASDLAGVEFVGGHPVFDPNKPMPKRGVDGADAKLFQGATYCLTPSVTATPAAIDTVSNLASLLGAKPYFIDASEHDGLAASVGQLPALLATALASVTMTSQGWRELGKLAGADLRAATELVPYDGKTAREQFIAHRADLLRLIDTTIEKLRELRGMIDREDAAALEALVKTIDDRRIQWLNGDLDKGVAPEVDMETIRNQTARLFLGGLAGRTPPKRK